jgi:GntR family transcriptional regulator, transcriptional repressor for pyruvate dehydrogenase complex
MGHRERCTLSLKNWMPIQKASFFQAVVYRFEELLRAGLLKPGEKLASEAELARTFQVSRPTLREALKALNLLGLLVSRTGDGTYVTEDSRNLFKTAIYFSTFLSAVDFLGLIEARIAIEPFLAELAAQRATKAEIERMKGHLQKMEGAVGQMQSYLDSEIAFHDEITKAARSAVLQGIMVSLRDLLLEGRTKITANQTGKRNFNFHVRIFEAIRRRDPESARRRMLEHLQDSRNRYEKFYQNLRISSISQTQYLPGSSLTAIRDVAQPERPGSRRRRKDLL